MGALLPAFNIADASGTATAFPCGGPALIAFVKEDCPTCNDAMPVLEAFHQAFGTSLPVLVPGQTQDGNRILTERHALTVPVLDDSALKVAFAYDIDTVPTLVLADADGREISRLEGFVRAEWQSLDQQIAELVGGERAAVDWPSLPEWRPGCGSMSVDPAIADRLQAEAENSPLRARKIEIAPGDDEFEFMFDQGFSDGLPIVPPTPERVIRMLSGTRRDAQDVVALVPPNLAPATVEKVAINAVMAGCKPAYLPVVIAALEAACTDDFNVHGVMATTMGASPVMVVNGPIRDRIGMNMKLGVTGQGNRANATIGRALRLAIRNIGGARPGGTERQTLGNPMKFTMALPEWEERSNWEPMHVERGFDVNDSVVTLFGMTSGPVLMVDQTSLSGDQLAGSFGLCLEGMHHPRSHRGADTLLVICPEHVDTFARDGYTKEDIRTRIQEVTSRPLNELMADDISGVGIPEKRLAAMSAADRARPVPKFGKHGDINIVVAGGEAGKFSGAFHGWVTGPMGTIPVSRKIDD